MKIGRQMLKTKLASRGKRFTAFCIDIILPILISVFITKATRGDKTDYTVSETSLNIHSITISIFLIIQIYYLSTVGQSIGKKVMKIKIVKLNAKQSPGFATTVLLRSSVNFLLWGMIPLYCLIDPLFICREDKRCIHDLMAGTLVINTNKS